MNVVRRRLFVHGRVQGVFFRDSTRDRALRERGPRGARVERVQSSDERSEGLHGFEIR